ncbi:MULTISPECIES: ankyrin repeat domain-containing protein [Actinomadura]|uniref:Ankyrin repeat domain-containing protein n=1 Tax=Actinomadura yumaensis TaxID=111807 RepID=A0ABW2CCL7_9ACTN|nr:ankyrin repeat domain-containing protein [Actinomadura sp. J1-007]MWK35550.1 ankyrin repeat domain-containing protein [Actinomadura sp. J1-007]
MIDAAVEAIRTGAPETLRRVLAASPNLATARPDGARTLLHVATDHPGHLPEIARTVLVLVEAGADVNAPFAGAHAETPLHWAASNDDVPAVDALVAAGADVSAPGSVIDGGTPLADAVAFGQWNAAHRLLEHGADPNLWQAAALGLLSRVQALTDPVPARSELSNALWCAAHGGHQNTAAHLLALGADLNWVGHDNLTPLDAARRSNFPTMAIWLESHGAHPT